MTKKFLRRLMAYKELLKRRIRARQGMAYKVKLERPLAKEFAFLYHGQLCPQFIEDYSDTYLAKLVRRCLSPSDVEQALRRRPDGKPIWEEL